MTTRTENSFQKYANDSNEAGLNALADFLQHTDFDVEVVEKQRSINDLVVTTETGEKILVEVKLRKKQYNTVLLEKKKADDLIKKAAHTGAIDAWYLSVAQDGSYLCFSLFDLITENNIIDQSNQTIGLSKSYGHLDGILLANMHMPRVTAVQSAFVSKLCYFIPRDMAMDRIITKKQKAPIQTRDLF